MKNVVIILFPFRKKWPELVDLWWHRLAVVIFYMSLGGSFFGYWLLGNNLAEDEYRHCINLYALDGYMSMDQAITSCSESLPHPFGSMILSLIITVILSYVLQVFYYKVLLYIVFGKKNA